MIKSIWVPVISRDVEFIAKHTRYANAIWEKTDIKTEAEKLCDFVYKRADEEVLKLLEHVAHQVKLGTKHGAKIVWKKKPDEALWSFEGRLHVPRSKKKVIGSVGFDFGYEETASRLIGWIWTWGGKSGRKKLVEACKKNFPGVCLTTEDSKRYPISQYEELVVWFDLQLTSKMALQDVDQKIALNSESFFGVAIPVLIKLAQSGL